MKRLGSRTLATVGLGAALALGTLTAAPAHAAGPEAGNGIVASVGASTDGGSSEIGVLAYQWVYFGSYPSRSACDAVANDMYRNYNIRGQCRGPYPGGRFDLYLWLDR